MAKKRNSVFSTGTSKEQVAKESKQIEREALGSGKSDDKTERRKYLYVDETHHRAAKLNAAKMGMKLSEYVEFLIDRHTT